MSALVSLRSSCLTSCHSTAKTTTKSTKQHMHHAFSCVKGEQTSTACTTSSPPSPPPSLSRTDSTLPTRQHLLQHLLHLPYSCRPNSCAKTNHTTKPPSRQIRIYSRPPLEATLYPKKKKSNPNLLLCVARPLPSFCCQLYLSSKPFLIDPQYTAVYLLFISDILANSVTALFPQIYLSSKPSPRTVASIQKASEYTAVYLLLILDIVCTFPIPRRACGRNG